MRLLTLIWFLPLLGAMGCRSAVVRPEGTTNPSATAIARSTPPLPTIPAGLAAEAMEREGDLDFQASGHKVAIATQGRAATRAAKEIIDQGGNLIDAAIAASFVISVERPQSTGLSGGGFFMYRQASTGRFFAVDFRERAPLAATEKMFLKADGTPDTELSRDRILSTAVPGLVAGLDEIHRKFGKLAWSKLVAPAIQLAEEGFEIYPGLAKAMKARESVLAKSPAAAAIFLDDSGKAWPAGHRLIQKDLAQTLRLIADKRRAGFYQGPVAQKIVQYFEAEKGLINQKDLDSYQVKWRTPVSTKFKGHMVYSMPPPSSGGVHVIQFLNMLENQHLAKHGFLSAKAVHSEAAALQMAFADRARYLGDTDFVKVPVQGLISKKYAEARRQQMPPERARKADEVSFGPAPEYESNQTTHLSMIDAQGNMIATTQTINGWMGSGQVVPQTGLLLNNEMDDFSAAPGSSNMFGAIGSQANAVAKGKTPLSSMSPTLVLQDKHPVLAVGAPGGTRIISCVAQTIVNLLEFKRTLYESVAAVRLHHQWKPDILEMDPPGPAPEVLQKLQQMGYEVRLQPVGCNVMAVQSQIETDLDTGHSRLTLKAVADPRDIGTGWAQ